MPLLPPRRSARLLAALPVAFFDRLPDVMLEVVLAFTCEDLKDFIKLGLIDKRWLLCTRQPWLHDKLKLPDGVFRWINSQEAMTSTLTKIGVCVSGLKTLEFSGRMKGRFVNDEGLWAICSSFPRLNKLGLYADFQGTAITD